MSEVKVFAINDCEWWAGVDIGSIKTAFIAEGYGDESSFCDPYPVRDLDMTRLKYVSENGAGETVERTFREQLDLMIATGRQFPSFFATTEM